MEQNMPKDPNKLQNKNCPYCHASLGFDDTQCYSCGRKVGKYNPRTGRTEKPTDWWSYVICILSWMFLIFYIWWAFLRD